MTKLNKVKDVALSLNSNKSKEKIAKFIISLFRYLVLIGIGYIVLYPLFAIMSLSIFSRADILDNSVSWISKTPTIQNFVGAFEALDYSNSLVNTVLVGMVSAAMEIFSCAIAAYGFARFKFKERGALFGLVLFTAIVPAQILVIPLFMQYTYFDFGGILTLFYDITGMTPSYINLVDTPLTFWLPSLFGVGLRSGLFIFIYRQFFMGLPKELEEASWIDGCGPFKTFLRIVIPSSGVVFLTVSIFSIIWHWNEYYQSVIFFSTEFPLSVTLSNIETYLHNFGAKSEFAVPYISAACLIFMAPVLIMYLFLQKKFIQSIDRVGIVG